MALIRNVSFEKALEKRVGRKFKLSQSKQGTCYRICCPYCPKTGNGPDRNYKLYITPAIGLFHCFRCDEAGPIDSLLADYKPGVIEQQVTHIEPLPSHIVSPGNLISLNNLSDDHIAIRYLKQRRFNIYELSNYYGVKFCDEGKLFAGMFNTTNTVVFPFWMNTKLIGWQARLLYDPDKIVKEQYEIYGFQKDEDGEYIVPPKYFTAPGLDKGRILFNYDQARTFKSVVICEGTFDAIRVGCNAVATLGKGVTDNQAKLIKAYWDFAVILLDPGDADREMKELNNTLKLSIPCVRVALQGYKDAGEAPREEIWNQIFDTVVKAGYDVNKLI